MFPINEQNGEHGPVSPGVESTGIIGININRALLAWIDMRRLHRTWSPLCFSRLLYAAGHSIETDWTCYRFYGSDGILHNISTIMENQVGVLEGIKIDLPDDSKSPWDYHPSNNWDVLWVKDSGWATYLKITKPDVFTTPKFGVDRSRNLYYNP